MSHKPLILVDGSSYLYRAFHAMPALADSHGRPTGAVYGVVNMLRKLIRDYQPEHMAVVFDAKGKTFRDAMFEDYKAHRPPMPAELEAQIEPLNQVIRAMGIPVLTVEGVEADDVIATLARQAEEQGMDVVISSGDKDLAQLVNEHVVVVNTMNDTVLDRAGVEAKFGIPPERIVDWLALVGDSSDNIPGVPGVGPKTAVKWLKQYGSLDEIVAHADEIKGKIGEKLRANLEQLELSRRLATVRRDVPLEVSVGDLRLQPPDRERLAALFRELEFKTWLAEVLEARQQEGETDPPAVDYELILDRPALERWLERLRQTELLALDTETTSLDYMAAELVGISFAVAPLEAAYLPLGHDYPGAPQQLNREEALALLRPLLEDPERPKVGHNLKYDLSVLARHGVALAGIRHDTMLESYVLDAAANRHDMDTLALKYLGHKTIAYHDVAGKGAKQIGFHQVPLEQAGPYAAEDADIALRLHQALWPRLQDQPRLQRLYEEIEIPLVPVLSRMERTGVLIDAARLEAQSAELAQKLAAIEAAAHQAAGGPFNLGSPKQIQEILFGRLGLPVIAKTPKGQPSTAEAVLQELAERGYELPRLILEHRALAKLKSTYTDKLPRQVNPETGRVHTSYHQAVAATGRLSSSDPNLQNIPVRTPEGRRIRQAFIAPEGHLILAADYSQIELRIMAHLSGDERLLAAFAAGEDIHTATAAEVFGIPPDQVQPEQRRHAKAINFGLIYGMSAFGLARQLGIERQAAQAYMDLYFQRYPGVLAFMERTRQQAREQGFVETLFGRRLYLPDINASNAQRRQYAERTAINAPMQGSAADIIKRAMIACDAWLRDSGEPARMIMQVHDELVFEVREDRVEAVAERVRHLMSQAAELAVPLEVETGVGENWDEAH